MKMDLIQPFISAVDSVLAETLQSPVTVSDLAMEEEGYRKKGVAAMIVFKGEIEGRVILDVEPRAAVRVASALSGEEVAESEQIVRETVCELANMVIGNAVTLLNDRGFKFKVFPPSIHDQAQIDKAGAEVEAVVLAFATEHGTAYVNIALHYMRRRQSERRTVAVQ